MNVIRVTVWNEYMHENKDDRHFSQKCLDLHPFGIHGTVKAIIDELGDKVSVRTVTMQDDEYGLSEQILSETDVLLWWAHIGHGGIPDEVADRVVTHIQAGMGFIALHSAHKSKPFMKILGTTGTLRWKDKTKEILVNICPSHPIMDGIPESITLDVEECYGEPFDIAKPDDVLMLGWYDVGEVFRSVATWTRGWGKIVYIQPGHETNTAYQNPYIRKIIQNSVLWAYSKTKRENFDCPQIKVTRLECE